MFEKIVVPLDGSAAAENALPYVSEIASRFGSRILLVRITSTREPYPGYEAGSYLREVTEKVRAQLRSWQARSETEVRSELRVGNPAVEILRYANDTICDLIVLSSHGASAETVWSLGNIAGKVIRASTSPALLVRKPAPKDALTQKRIIKRILLPLDGSKFGEAALPYAEALAKLLEAEIILFQVIEPQKYFVTATDTTGTTVSSLNDYEKWVKPVFIEYLNKIRESVIKIVPDVSVVTAEGSAADRIIDYAETNSIDLIAMATHGRSGVGRWVFGSVTDKVLHAGDTPVLVVRSSRR